MSLAIAVVASAAMAEAMAELKRSRADFEQAGTEIALDGVALRAEATILDSRRGERFAWTLPSEGGAFEVLAEAEAPKLGLAAAAAAPASSAWVHLGVRDPAQLQVRLANLSSERGASRQIPSADSAPMWRACGRSLVSPWGTSTIPHMAPAAPPAAATEIVHIGEVWRLRITAPNGFADDRVVRFTGDPRRPAALVERILYRTTVRGDICDALADAKP